MKSEAALVSDVGDVFCRVARVVEYGLSKFVEE